MKHNKPTGNIGPNKVILENESYKLSWDKVVFPTVKEDIELYYCEKFAEQIIKAGGEIYSIKQNEENHLDFSLELPGGHVYLDLAEVIIPDYKSSPYANESIKISYSEYIDSILNIVIKKSNKYQSKSTIPIFLLLYCTHWRFIPNDEIIYFLQYYLVNNESNFENIFLYIPLDNIEGHLHVLFPTDNLKFKNITPEIAETYRNKFYLNLNPNKFELLKS
jgi:hypothetical protein